MLGRNSLLQFYVAVNAFQDQLCIDRPICSLEDELDGSAIETWDFVGVSVNVCDLYKDFFANDAILKISNFINPHIVKTLEKFVDQVQIQLMNTDNSANLSLSHFSNSDNTLIGVKCILVAFHETLSIFRREDFPAFLKHPIGQKLSSRLIVSNSPLRFLRGSRSPERSSLEQQRSSLESDRSSSELDEQFDFSKRQKRLSGLMLGSTMKMIGKMGSGLKPKPATEDRDLFLTPVSPPIPDTDMSNVEGELMGIINSEENSFAPPSVEISFSLLSAPNSARKKVNRLAPFFGDYKMQQKAEDIAQSGKLFLENFRFKKNEAVCIEKPLQGKNQEKSKGSSFDETSPSSIVDFSSGKGPDSVISESTPGLSRRDADAESFIQLELEEQQGGVANDEEIIMDQNSDLLPPMIILPARFFHLDVTLENLQKDLDDIEKQIKETEKNNDIPKLKLLKYTKRGIWQEMQEAMSEKEKIEILELENVIFSVWFYFF